MCKKSIVVFVIGLGLTASTVFAQGSTTPPPTPEQIIAAVDTDKDGYVTKAEAAKDPHLTADFDKIDTSKDGKVSAEELKAFLATLPKP